MEKMERLKELIEDYSKEFVEVRNGKESSELNRKRTNLKMYKELNPDIDLSELFVFLSNAIVEFGVLERFAADKDDISEDLFRDFVDIFSLSEEESEKLSDSFVSKINEEIDKLTLGKESNKPTIAYIAEGFLQVLKDDSKRDNILEKLDLPKESSDILIKDLESFDFEKDNDYTKLQSITKELFLNNTIRLGLNQGIILLKAPNKEIENKLISNEHFNLCIYDCIPYIAKGERYLSSIFIREDILLNNIAAMEGILNSLDITEEEKEAIEWVAFQFDQKNFDFIKVAEKLNNKVPKEINDKTRDNMLSYLYGNSKLEDGALYSQNFSNEIQLDYNSKIKILMDLIDKESELSSDEEIFRYTIGINVVKELLKENNYTKISFASLKFMHAATNGLFDEYLKGISLIDIKDNTDRFKKIVEIVDDVNEEDIINEIFTLFYENHTFYLVNLMESAGLLDIQVRYLNHLAEKELGGPSA